MLQPLQSIAAAELLQGVADAEFAAAAQDVLDALANLPGTLTIRRCERYAFCALYPEQYLAAARALPRGACVMRRPRSPRC